MVWRWLSGMVLVTSASSAELPHRWAAPKPVTGCEAFGPEFHKVDGSDTCVRVTGSVSVEANIVTGGSGWRGSRH